MSEAQSCEARARERVGKMFGPILGWDVVNDAMIRQWWEVFGYATSSPRNGLATGTPVPVTMLPVWTMPGYAGHHATGSAGCDAWDVLNVFAESGFTKAVGISTAQHYDRLPALGDRIRYLSHVHAISGLKRTALGEGYFVTVRYAFVNQLEQAVGSMDFTMLVACPSAPGETEGVKPNSGPGDTVHALEAREPGHELRVPVTTTSIVATAIATRDFHPVHHDLRFAQASGSPDIFMNILAVSAYVERFLYELAPPCSRIASIAVKLALPIYPGDTVSFTSSHDNGSEPWRDVLVAGCSQRGKHVDATVRLERKEP